MHRCPKCGSEDLMGSKTTLPSRGLGGSARVAHEFYCKQCRFLEGAVEGESGFDEMIDRWTVKGPQTTQ